MCVSTGVRAFVCIAVCARVRACVLVHLCTQQTPKHSSLHKPFSPSLSLAPKLKEVSPGQIIPPTGQPTSGLISSRPSISLSLSLKGSVRMRRPGKSHPARSLPHNFLGAAFPCLRKSWINTWPTNVSK